VAREDLAAENAAAVKKGSANLVRHIHNVKRYGVPVTVAINRFGTDMDAEIAAIQAAAASEGVEAILCTHFADGSKGAEALAKKVVQLAESGAAQFAPLYPDDMPLFDKAKTIATEIYAASDLIADKTIRDRLHGWEKEGRGNLPICIAKTQYSFSTDPNLKNAPSNHVVPIREVRLSAGAGFVVVICGEIMTMPGLPSVPAANSIRINEDGDVVGLF
jgi:formate--tetrahydrofolate ligase